MKKSAKILMGALLAVGLMGGLSSCKKGPAERAGEKIDNGVENVKEAGRDMRDDIKR